MKDKLLAIAQKIFYITIMSKKNDIEKEVIFPICFHIGEI